MDNSVLLKQLKKTLKERLAVNIDRVILFGSRITENADQYSDYDILIILEENYDWKVERNIFDICYELDLENNIIIDAKIISLPELNSIKGKQPYIQNAIEMGISA